MADSKTYYLVEAYMQERLTAAEKQELEILVSDKASEEEVVEALKKYLATMQPDSTVDKEALAYIWKNAVAVDKDIQPAKIISLKKTSWRAWVAAASIIIIIAATAIVISNPPAGGEKSPATEVATTNDVQAPKETRAVITLADGSKVYLDSANNGTIAQQNNVNVVKNTNGEVVYAMSPAGGGGLNETPNNKRPGVDYNTLSNPRGSKVISLTLSDGTRVWLNAGSSLRYPASFASSAVNREVKITGEAYFEVAHDASKPFIVSKNDVSVTVLGTHFNVNAYDDESDIKITLLEGSVRVNKGSNTGLLKPGQQAQVSSSVKVLNNTDVEQVMAWKNGKFSFNGSDIKTVMRELARWYDVNVEYKDEIKETFFVKLDRNTNMSNVFRILQTTGAVHFKIEGKKVTVMQ